MSTDAARTRTLPTTSSGRTPTPRLQGAATIDDGVNGGPWPLPPGKYDVLLLADDSYAELARTSFVVAREAQQ